MARQIVPTRRMALSLLGSILLAGCQPGTPTERTPALSPPSPVGRQPSATPVAATAPGLTPAQRLTALADTVGAIPTDASAALPFTYLHTQTWARSTTVITRTDLQRWRHTNGSGREIIRRLPDLPGIEHEPQPDERKRFTGVRETSTSYFVDELHPYLPEPLPTDQQALTAQLAPGLTDEPAYPRLLAGGIVGLATSQYLNQQQRATTLRVLATIPHIAYRGETRDLAGRRGLAFVVAADDTTSTLIIAPSTGELLAAQEKATGRRAGLFSYVLILERGRTTTDTEAR
jgi:hypothetical protein